MTRTHETKTWTKSSLVLVVALLATGCFATLAHADEACGADHQSIELGGLPARVPTASPTFDTPSPRPHRTVELGGLPARIPVWADAVVVESCPEPDGTDAVAQRSAAPRAYSRASFGMP